MDNNNPRPVKLTFLGTGTSTGVPQMLCDCDVCHSSDPHDNRLRTSALVEMNDGRRILIDCGPDFRQQMLRIGCPGLDAALLTHIHFDHVGGLDDLRPYCGNMHGAFPLYCQDDVARDIHRRLPYCFKKNTKTMVPSYEIHTVKAGHNFTVDGNIDVTPLRVMHWNLPILGYRIGPLAYITDCRMMPTETLCALAGVDTLVINALRVKEHISHMNLKQALDVISVVNPRRAYLAHISHDMGFHAEVDAELPMGVRLAYDGLEIEI